MGNGSNSNIPNEEYDLFTELSFEIIREKVNTVGDWINNEGGFGTIEINVQNQTYELDYNQRTTEGYNWSDCNLV